MEIKVQKLTAEAFAQYGQVINLSPAAEPTAGSDDFSYWKQQLVFDITGPAEIGVLKTKKHEMIFDQIEQHTETPEILIGLGGGFIIPVAPPSDDVPDPEKIEAFEVSANQAIMMKTNCWHWLPNPADKDELTIMVLFKNNTSADDLVIKDLPLQCTVVS